jgi:hypothetical protein
VYAVVVVVFAETFCSGVAEAPLAETNVPITNNEASPVFIMT